MPAALAVPASTVAVAGPVSGLLLVVFAVLGFAIVAVVAAVILALIHIVLPGTDSEADALHRAEQERQTAAQEHDAEADSTDLHPGHPLL